MPNSRNSPKAIEKYVRRGWRIYFVPTPDDLAHPMDPPFLLNKMRWVGDKHTWILPLDQTGVKERPPLSPASAPLKFDHVRCNGWNLKLSKGFAANGYQCQSYPLQSTVFRYNYAIPDEELSLDIRAWAHLQGKFSHYQVPKDDWVWCVFFLERSLWLDAHVS